MEILKFSAEWCGPCKVLKSKLSSFDKCKVTEYDVDDVDDDLLSKYGIRGVPVTILLDNDANEVNRWVGVFDINELSEKIDELNNA